MNFAGAQNLSLFNSKACIASSCTQQWLLMSNVSCVHLPVCRDKLERSTAVLCPSVAYQLAGAKKVQQDLAQPDVLSRFVDSSEDAQLLQACFAGVKQGCGCMGRGYGAGDSFG